MIKTHLFILILLFSKALFSQCSFDNFVIKSGEIASYQVYYKIGFLWFNAAKVDFSTYPTHFNEKKAFHFVSKGQTLPNYDWIYKVRDVYQSKVDSATLSPIFFNRNISEGSLKVNNTYQFDYNKNIIYSKIQSSEKGTYADTLKINNCTLDMLTAIYVCRNIDFKQLNISDTIPLSVVVDNNIYPLYIRYLGTEQISIKQERVFSTQKFSVLLVEGTIFTGGEDMTVWVSNDKARVPVKVEANILVGSIVAYLDSIKGNKWGLSAEIK